MDNYQGKNLSDGYATGFAVCVLRQAGLPAERPELVRGIRWLKRNQRVSGSWFTPHAEWGMGLKTQGGIGTRDLAILNLSTAFAVMALHACENTKQAK